MSNGQDKQDYEIEGYIDSEEMLETIRENPGEVLSLTNEEGEEYSVTPIAHITIQDKEYLALLPCGDTALRMDEERDEPDDDPLRDLVAMRLEDETTLSTIDSDEEMDELNTILDLWLYGDEDEDEE